MVALAGWLGQWNQWLPLNPSPASGVGLAALFILVLRQQRWSLPLLKWLGVLSYPVYLLHVLILLLVFQQWHISGWTGAALALSIILAAAAVLHRWVEQPCIAWGQTLISAGTKKHHAYPAQTV